MNRMIRRIIAAAVAVGLAAVVNLPVGLPTAKAAPGDPLILKYDLSKALDQTDPLLIILPLEDGVDVTIDWGDGTRDVYTANARATHIYATVGQYTVQITGTLGRLGRGEWNCKQQNGLVEVVSWGELGLKTLNNTFCGARNLIAVPKTFPSTVTDTTAMFQLATGFNQDLSGWNMSNVVNMRWMFEGAKSFNGDISNWDTSNVIAMNRMFLLASSFNGDISKWDTSKVKVMTQMFDRAGSFDQDLSRWDVGSLTNAANMFKDAKLSVGNYDNLLISWAKQAESAVGVLKKVPFSGGNSKYSCSAIEARATLIGVPHEWIVTDAGLSQVPGKPTITDVVEGDGKLEVQFDPPSCPSGDTIENYQVSLDGGDTWVTPKPAVTSGPFIIDGLTNNTRYAIKVRAINEFGVGSSSKLRYGRPNGPEPEQPADGSATSTTDPDGPVSQAFTVSMAKPSTTLSGKLPATGSDSLMPALLALGAILLGGMVIGASRRRTLVRT